MAVNPYRMVFGVPTDERRRWREAAKGVADQGATELEAKGLPGKALLQDARALAAKYGEAD